MQTVYSNDLSAIEVQWQLTLARVDQWLQNEVFHFRWWLLLVLFAACAFFWWKKVDKSRLQEIVLYTAIITIITLVLDELGEELTLWDYPFDLIPLFPPLTAIDLSCLPIVYSMIYQHFRTWKGFVIASIVMAGIFCFLLEPLFVWIGVYQMLTWKSYYGFPIYLFMAIGAKALVSKIYTTSLKSEG